MTKFFIRLPAVPCAPPLRLRGGVWAWWVPRVPWEALGCRLCRAELDTGLGAGEGLGHARHGAPAPPAPQHQLHPRPPGPHGGAWPRCPEDGSERPCHGSGQRREISSDRAFPDPALYWRVRGHGIHLQPQPDCGWPRDSLTHLGCPQFPGAGRGWLLGGEANPVGRQLCPGLQYLRPCQFQHPAPQSPVHQGCQGGAEPGEGAHCHCGQQTGPAPPAGGVQRGGPAPGPLLRLRFL